MTSIIVPFCSLFLIYDDSFLDKFQKILLILLLHALVTPLLPPLNGLLVHIFRSAPRLPAYKRVNRFWPLTTLPTKYKCAFSSLHAFFHFFCGIYLSYFQSVASICRSICFCDIYLSYFNQWHIFAKFSKMSYIWQRILFQHKINQNKKVTVWFSEHLRSMKHCHFLLISIFPNVSSISSAAICLFLTLRQFRVFFLHHYTFLSTINHFSA